MSRWLKTCSVSGGKDSTVLYRWMTEKYGKDGFLAVFADTGHEHPVTLNYVRNLPELAGGPPIHWVEADFTERLHETRNIKPTGLRFLDLILWKGRPPSRRAQFCTEQLKLSPIAEWLEDVRGDRLVAQFTGIRAGESARRAKMKMFDEAPLFRRFKTDRVYTVRPLLRWTEAEIFEFLKSRGIPPNPLYSLGFGRVGCFPCINAGKRELTRLPDWAWDRIQEYETRSGRTWFHWGMIPPTEDQKFLINRLPQQCPLPKIKNGEHFPVDEDYSALLEAHPEWMPTVPQVREWSKTSRGGVQYELFSEDANDVPSCMSTWGVCD